MQFFVIKQQHINPTQLPIIENKITQNNEIDRVILTQVTFQNSEDFNRLIKLILARPNMRSITLNSIQLSENILETLCSVPTSIEQLKIEYCTVDSQAIFALPVSPNTTLRELSISNLIATELQLNQLLVSIRSFSCLIMLNLAMHLGRFQNQISEIIKYCLQLQSLNLTSAVIDEQYLESVLTSIEAHPSIKHLECDAAVLHKSGHYSNLPDVFFNRVNAVLQSNLSREQQPPDGQDSLSCFKSLRSSPTLELKKYTTM